MRSSVSLLVTFSKILHDKPCAMTDIAQLVDTKVKNCFLSKVVFQVIPGSVQPAKLTLSFPRRKDSMLTQVVLDRISSFRPVHRLTGVLCACSIQNRNKEFHRQLVRNAWTYPAENRRTRATRLPSLVTRSICL